MSTWRMLENLLDLKQISDDVILVNVLKKVPGLGEGTHEWMFYLVKGITMDHAAELFRTNPDLLFQMRVKETLDTTLTIRIFWHLRKSLNEAMEEYEIPKVVFRVDKTQKRLIGIYDIFLRYFYKNNSMNRVERDDSLPTCVRYRIYRNTEES